MTNRLFVGGLAWATTDDSLQAFFSEAGTVVSAEVKKDRFTNRSQGYGFVEMSSEEEAQKAIEMFNGKELDGRAITVDEARPPKPREDRGGSGRY